MRAAVTITDLTRMRGDHICVAGYLRDGTCIRPLFPWHSPLTESWVWLKGQVVIRPFAEVELDLQEHTPHPPHSEDYIVKATYYRLLRHLNTDRRLELLRRIEDPDVASIFGAPIHMNNGWYLLAGQGARSLGTVRPAEIERVGYALKEAGRWDYRLAFKDAAGVEYWLAVTDLAFRCYMDHARLVSGQKPVDIARQMTDVLRTREVFIRIGLARGWEKHPDRCHLQITGVYSFPDYLNGKCFADFVEKQDKGAQEEMPF
jgi:hypothetical protein